MDDAEIGVGVPVHVAAGIFKGVDGVVEDYDPRSSAVRVYSSDGPAYAYKEDLVRARPKPKPAKSAIKK